jgi:hypothetical protein
MPHDTDTCEHSGAAECRDQDQGFHCCLPFCSLVLGLRQLRDVVAGVLESDELASAGKRDRIFEKRFPAAIGHLRLVATSPR